MSNVSTQTQADIQKAAQKKDALTTIGGMLEQMKPQMSAALPKHITPDRMMRVALTAIQNTPKLLECDKKSLLMAILRASQLGLEPDGILGQAYLIPYGKQVQLIVGYKGLIDLARRSGEVSNIIAREVCANDLFTVDFSQEIPFVHKPLLEGDRGPVKFFWALARFKDGGFHWDYMSREEVLKIRDGSSGWQAAVKFKSTANSPWVKHEIEMGKKTVIRRISKYLPMSVQKAAIIEELVDANRKFEVGDFGDITVEQEEIRDITPDDIEKTTGNDKVKKALESKVTKTVSKDAPNQEADKTIEIIMPDGEVLKYPGTVTSSEIDQVLKGMSDAQEQEFMRQNYDHMGDIIARLNADGAVQAADFLTDLVTK